MATNADAGLLDESSSPDKYVQPIEVAEIVKRLKASKAQEEADRDECRGFRDGYEWAAKKASYSSLQGVAAMDHQAEEISFMAYLNLSDTIEDASDAYARGFIVGAKHVWDEVKKKI